MPRGARLDALGVLHHVMGRGIDRQPIFRDDEDRDDLVRRIAALVRDRQFEVFAWALMLNHFHLLVRTGEQPLERSMRSLLTGFATAFNRRHDRVGHLFQNRYRSIVCEAEGYFLELVRYIHLNPVRGGIVPDLDALEDYPYTGHSALLGTVPRDWQATEPVLKHFGRSAGWARAAYRQFVAEGVALGRRPELTGGGLVRGARGWSAVAELERGRERFTSHERILGSERFVDQMLRELDPKRGGSGTAPPPPELSTLKEMVCEACSVSIESISTPGRTRPVSKAREGLAYLWIEFFGQSGRRLAADLGLKAQALYKAASRGRAERDRWARLLDSRRNAARSG